MIIGINTIYKEYFSDKIFDVHACKLGQNLLMPYTLLKEKVEKQGGEVHTLDLLNLKDVDIVLFFDLPEDSIVTIRNPIKVFIYFVKKKWKYDFFLKILLMKNRPPMYLIINEPPVVNNTSYRDNYHVYFKKIFTWNRDLVDNKKIFLLSIPQPFPSKLFFCPFEKKRKYVIVSSNKSSKHKDELYSARKRIISFFEERGLDLYGYGWEKENLKCYRGITENKLETLSKYKFCFCFENMKNISGYVTEKIFDCFFSKCVPIYFGAEDITEIIPTKCFIDFRQFNSLEELEVKLNKIGEEEYSRYLFSAEQFINSNEFKNNFGIEKYVESILQGIEVKK